MCFVPIFVLLYAVGVGAQQPSSDDLNKANNPLTPAITVNCQNEGRPLL